MNPRPPQLRRLALVVLSVLVLGGGSLGYVLHARHRGMPTATGDGSFSLAEPGLYYRDSATGRVARSSGTGAARHGGPACERFYAAGNAPCACASCRASRPAPRPSYWTGGCARSGA